MLVQTYFSCVTVYSALHIVRVVRNKTAKTVSVFDCALETLCMQEQGKPPTSFSVKFSFKQARAEVISAVLRLNPSFINVINHIALGYIFFYICHMYLSVWVCGVLSIFSQNFTTNNHFVTIFFSFPVLFNW